VGSRSHGVQHCRSQFCAAFADAPAWILAPSHEQRREIGLRRHTADQASLREASCDVELMVIDVLAVLSLPRNDHRCVSGLQRGHDGANASMTDDAVSLRHGINHLLIRHKLDPDAVWHVWPRGSAPVLDDKSFAVAGKGLDEVERPGARLLMGAEAKKDQTLFLTTWLA
jgi:hypothetical protein